MGRLFSRALGISLLAISIAPAARGQEPGSGNPPAVGQPPAAVPGPATAQAPEKQSTDAPLSLSTDVTAGADDKAAADEHQNQPVGSAFKSVRPSSATEPAGRADRSRDPALVRTGGDANAPAQPAEPAAGKTGLGPASELLHVGKQSVQVTVDVQSPANMNLNQEATMKLLVRNTGASDALNVRILDELPPGVDYISSQPEAHVGGTSLLSWSYPILQTGTEKVIVLRVKPTKTGPFDHIASVHFETGSKSRTTVVQPRLKVDMAVNPSAAKVLKGSPVEFQVSVTNTGDGPARGVTIKAILSPGLRHDSDDREYELTLPDLAPNQTEKLDPLVVDALVKGEQFCKVTASSPDVVFNQEEAECTKMVMVVAPELKISLTAPESRYTDTIADYEVNLENIGTAPARKVRVVSTLPAWGKLMKIPQGADWDKATRKLSWKFDVIDSGKKEHVGFSVKMTGSGNYQCLTEAVADNTPVAKDARTTDVVGMAVVELEVFEPRRVIDVEGVTTFQIRLFNSGTKDANNLSITAELTKNLKVVGTMVGSGVPKEVEAKVSPAGDEVKFLKIEKLPKEKEIVLGIKVKAETASPKMATCRVKVTYDDMTEPIDDMAGVKVTTTRRTAAAPAAAESNR
jgi:uncharacterized repeat protein (TIGR01451 family)